VSPRLITSAGNRMGAWEVPGTMCQDASRDTARAKKEKKNHHLNGGASFTRSNRGVATIFLDWGFVKKLGDLRPREGWMVQAGKRLSVPVELVHAKKGEESVGDHDYKKTHTPSSKTGGEDVPCDLKT